MPRVQVPTPRSQPRAEVGAVGLVGVYEIRARVAAQPAEQPAIPEGQGARAVEGLHEKSNRRLLSLSRSSRANSTCPLAGRISIFISGKVPSGVSITWPSHRPPRRVINSMPGPRRSSLRRCRWSRKRSRLQRMLRWWRRWNLQRWPFRCCRWSPLSTPRWLRRRTTTTTSFGPTLSWPPAGVGAAPGQAQHRRDGQRSRISIHGEPSR